MFKAQKRLQGMCPNERLDEELFCLSNWLSVNRYESNGRFMVIRDFKTIISNMIQEIEILPVGSFVYEMYLLCNTVIYIECIQIVMLIF